MEYVMLIIHAALIIGAFIGTLFGIWLGFQLLSLALYLTGRLIVLMFNLALPWRWKKIRFRSWPEHRAALSEFKGHFLNFILDVLSKNKSGGSSAQPSAPVRQDERVYIEIQAKTGAWDQIGTTTTSGLDSYLRSYRDYKVASTYNGRARARGATTGALYASWSVETR